MTIVCKRVTYGGLVQGVGFRYAAREIASDYAIAGFVRNLSDGNVELVAQGEASVVDAFLAAVARRMHAYIARTEMRDEKPANYAGFEIRF
jgi:acylphosphatase